MSSNLFLFTLLCLLVSVGIIYPPTEFVSAGFTISSIFSKFLGSENENFIQYHIRRSVITLTIHSLLPFVYIFLLFLTHDNEEIEILWNDNLLIQLFSCFAIIVPVFVLHRIFIWSRDDWKNHPICYNLLKFSNSNSNWMSVASDVNVEYRRVDKICIQLNSIYKIIATDNWILKVTSYGISFAHQSDSVLIVRSCDTHTISPHNTGEVQYINIEVKSVRSGVAPFIIRLNALDFNDLQDKCVRPITVLANVVFHKTLLDRFIEAFKEQIKQNQKYETSQELEQCIGCMQIIANVKIQKLCNEESGDLDQNCVNCYCRPMWCVECMARWFASRQEGISPETWLALKCTCPICRAKFCMFDVSPVTVIT